MCMQFNVMPRTLIIITMLIIIITFIIITIVIIMNDRLSANARVMAINIPSPQRHVPHRTTVLDDQSYAVSSAHCSVLKPYR